MVLHSCGAAAPPGRSSEVARRFAALATPWVLALTPRRELPPAPAQPVPLDQEAVRPVDQQAGLWGFSSPGRPCVRDATLMTAASEYVRCPAAGHRPRSMSRLRTGSGFCPHARQTEVRGALWADSMRHFGKKARLQGLSPLESPLPPTGGLDLAGARCSPGFSISPGLSPVSPWADASIGPPLTGLAYGRSTRRPFDRLEQLGELLQAASQSVNPVSRETEMPSGGS